MATIALLALVTLAASAPAHISLAGGPQFQLTTRVTSGCVSKDSLYLTAEHLSAGTAHAVFNTTFPTENALARNENGTQIQIFSLNAGQANSTAAENQTKTVPTYLRMGLEDHSALWSPVFLDETNGPNPGNLYFNGTGKNATGLEWDYSTVAANNTLMSPGAHGSFDVPRLGMWLVCDWRYGMPQLFWVPEWTQVNSTDVGSGKDVQWPKSCSAVELRRVMVDPKGTPIAMAPPYPDTAERDNSC